jgi:predicted GNAT superfamily acetyltransferase
MGITIRPLTSGTDMRACQELQFRVWGFRDGLEALPFHLLIAVPKNGGLVLGAFDEEALVGFVFGYPGLEPSGKPKHCSDMMGVAPEARDQGVGYQLKLAQRQYVLAQRLDLVTWTYDPLESRNARLNLHKLGGVCRTYAVDFYGPMTDALNRGVPTDRMQVEWWVASTHVRQSLRGERDPDASFALELANRTGRSSSGLLTPGPLALKTGLESVLYEIPSDFQRIKTLAPDLACEWRLATREAFEAFFAAGYVATDFCSRVTGGERHSAYVLQTCPDW